MCTKMDRVFVMSRFNEVLKFFYFGMVCFHPNLSCWGSGFIKTLVNSCLYFNVLLSRWRHSIYMEDDVVYS